MRKKIISMILISALLLSGCSMPWQDDEEKKETETAEETPAIIEEEPEKETPVIVVKSSGNFAEDVTEEEKERLEEGAQDGDGTEAETTQEPPEATNIDKLACEPGQAVSLDPNWEYASFSKIHDGSAVYYAATENRCGLVVGVNAGHGTKGGTSVKTYCHPDMTPKVTGGTTAAGSVEAVAVSGGMTFTTGESEASVNLRLARFLRDALLEMGYDVLMIRDGDDVQLDNVARTVICNNVADCHVAIHFDGDSQSSDKGCFFMSVPDGIKSMPPVDRTWHMSEELGTQIIMALGANGHKICGNGSMAIDLTQTSYSTIPSVDVEFGNQCSDTSDENLRSMALATAAGIDSFFDVSN